MDWSNYFEKQQQRKRKLKRRHNESMIKNVLEQRTKYKQQRHFFNVLGLYIFYGVLLCIYYLSYVIFTRMLTLQI